MRTTIELDEEATRAIQQLRRERGLGVSEAVNELIRRGMLHRPPSVPFSQPTRRAGLRLDVSNVAEALDVLDRDRSR
jgi:hypothetical protein